MFIGVKLKEDRIVWIAIMVAYKVVEREWEQMKNDKCLITQWGNIFNCMRALDGLMKSIQLAIKGATAVSNDILEKVDKLSHVVLEQTIGMIIFLKNSGTQLNIPGQLQT